MDGKTLARIGAIIFIAMAITATAIEMNRPAERPKDPTPIEQTVIRRDPLREQLARCGGMGEASARDPVCLRAWAENRRRFLGQPETPASKEQTVSGGPTALSATAPDSATPDPNGSR